MRRMIDGAASYNTPNWVLAEQISLLPQSAVILYSNILFCFRFHSNICIQKLHTHNAQVSPFSFSFLLAFFLFCIPTFESTYVGASSHD